MSEGREPPPRRSGPGLDWARARVEGPAIGLVVLSTITAGLSLVGLVALSIPGLNQHRGEWSSIPVDKLELGSSLAVELVILVGAIFMMRLENRPLALAACVLAVIPCTSPCCCIGIPFGIWGLSALHDPQVREAFRRG